MKTLGFVLSISLCLFASYALATLGEHTSTVDQDVSKLKASQKASTSESDYTVHEMVADGNTIKEFATTAGIVFAVSWRGISKPDLSVLFGSYYDEYKASLEAAPKLKGKRSASVQTSRMILKRGGHMRDQRGFAYIPSLVPAGLKLGDLE
jgi:hypothetical protein